MAEIKSYSTVYAGSYAQPFYGRSLRGKEISFLFKCRSCVGETLMRGTVALQFKLKPKLISKTIGISSELIGSCEK